MICPLADTGARAGVLRRGGTGMAIDAIAGAGRGLEDDAQRDDMRTQQPWML